MFRLKIVKIAVIILSLCVVANAGITGGTVGGTEIEIISERKDFKVSDLVGSVWLHKFLSINLKIILVMWLGCI